MRHILLIGRAFSAYKDTILENGDEYTLLMDIRLTKFPNKKFKRRVLCDFSSKESILKQSEIIHALRPIDAVVSTYENYILPAAWIAQHLDISGLSEESALSCTDKELMRDLFSRANEKISPSFTVVSSEDDIRAFASVHTFPLILKPANLAKSLLVTKNDNLETLLLNYRSAIASIDDIYRQYAPYRMPKLILEEFMVGSIHSVDAFMGSDGVPHVLPFIVDYQTGYDIGYADNFHYSRILPSKLSQQDQEALIRCAEIGIQSLGITNSPAHVEIIMTSKGPRIVEIGARNGGYRERMHRLANGLNIPKLAIDAATDSPIDLSASDNSHCAVLELFPRQRGKFKELSNFDKLTKLSSLKTLTIKAKLGQIVGKSSEGYKMSAVIVLHNNSSKVFSSDLEFITNHVEVITQ